MLRNDTNERIWLCDGVVLPRMWDAPESLLDLLEYGQLSHGTRWNVRALPETNDARHLIEFCGVVF